MTVDRRRERLILFVLATIQFSHVCDFVLLMPLGPQLMRVMSLSPAQFSLLVSSYTWSAGISGFFASLFADRFDRKRVLLFCYFGFLGGTLFCGLSGRYELLLAARVVAGAFGGTLAALIFAILADIVPEARRGAATGVLLSAFSIASVLGIPIGLFLATHQSWSFPFIVIAALGLLVWVLAAFQLPSLRGHLSPEGPARLGADLKYVVTDGTHVRAYLLTTFVIGGGFLVIPFISPYLVGNVGLQESDLPFVYFFGGLFTFFTSRFIGTLADRYGSFRVYVSIAASSVIPLLLMTNLPPVPRWATLVVTTLFFVLVSGRWVPAMALITSSALPRVRGSFLSFNSSVQQIALGLATFLSGHIVGRTADGKLTHYPLAGAIAVVITLSSIFIARRVRPANVVLKSAA
jgi:predicted MFS family arabinose efflux permease